MKEVAPLARSIPTPPEPGEDSISQSRGRAVNAVIRGGAAAGLGFGAVFASSLGVFGSASLLVGLGAALVAGTGLVWVGRAARHLLRFGSKGSAIGFVSAGALGVVAATWPATVVLRGMGIWSAPMWLRHFLGVSLLGLSMVVLFFVLRLVANWVMAEGKKPKEEQPIG